MVYAIGCLLFFTVAACRPPADDAAIRFEQLNIEPITEQYASGRVYADISLHHVLTLPVDSDVKLFDLGPVVADTKGHIYVVDYGVDKVFRFSSNGEYVTSYGTGVGEAPGELLSISDFGVSGNSIVYIVDSYGRKVSFYEMDGTFIRSRPVSHQPWRYARTDGGREYTLFANHFDAELESRIEDDVVAFDRFATQPDEIGLWTGGWLNTYQEHLIYALVRFPIVLRYAPDGSMVYARTTPDYADFEEPDVEHRMLGGTQARRVTGEILTGSPIAVENEHLFVHTNIPGGAVDVYDVGTGNYKYSMRLPVNTYTYVKNDRIYQSQDSTVSVWAIERPSG